MTFNLRGPWDSGENAWKNRREAVAELIRELRPDILGTQEGVLEQLRDLEERLPEYAWIGVAREDGLADGEHCAIFYRRNVFSLLSSGTFWLSEMEDVPGSRSWDSACTRICTWAMFEEDGQAWSVYNCHLDHISKEARLRGIELVMRRAVAASGVVVMGDLNEGEGGSVVHHLSQHLLDTFRAVRPDERAVATYTGFDPTQLDGDKIDYIFCSRDMRVHGSEIIRTTYGGRQPSDHFPVTADLAPELSRQTSE